MKNYIYPALAVTIIALLSGLLLSLVNDMTKEKREQFRVQKVERFLQEVFPSATSKIEIIINPESQTQEDANSFIVEDKRGLSTTVKAWQGLNDEGIIVGRAYQSYAQGYGDRIELILGVTFDGAITTYKIIDKKGETPGLGSKIDEDFFVQQWTNMKLGPELKLEMSGGNIKAITGATISCVAVLNAVEIALILDEKIRRDVIEIRHNGQQTRPEN